MSGRLSAVMDEAATVLQEISGLRVFAWPPGTLTPPAGCVSYPERFAYDPTYGNSLVRMTGLPMILVAGKATERSARDKVSAWSDLDGPESVRALMEAHTWRCFSTFTVTECGFDTVTIAGVDYLAAMFQADAM